MKRKYVVERYKENLSGIEDIRLCKQQNGVDSNYSYFPVVFDEFRKKRNEVFIELSENDIHPRKYFYPLTSQMECYQKYSFPGSDKTPIAMWLANRVLTLPLYGDMSIEDVDRICGIILGNNT